MTAKTLFGLPSEVKHCSNCVISNQRPSSTIEFKNKSSDKKKVIEFSEENICSACLYNKIKEQSIDWDMRDKKLMELCDRHRKSNGDYDVIVPGSGGKDSALHFAYAQIQIWNESINGNMGPKYLY